MLAQWKSDRLITCKSLDRNEDMLESFFYVSHSLCLSLLGSIRLDFSLPDLTIIPLQSIIDGIENDRSRRLKYTKDLCVINQVWQKTEQVNTLKSGRG